MKQQLIAPSILSADFNNLGKRHRNDKQQPS